MAARSIVQMLLASFAVGLMLGAGFTRTARHLGNAHAYVFGGDAAGGAAGGADGAEAAAGGGEGRPGAAPSAEPAPPAPPRVPLPLQTTAMGGGSFAVIEEAGALPRMGTLDFGLCRSSQAQKLDSDGFESYEDVQQSDHEEEDEEGGEGHGGLMGLPGCSARGLNGTVLVLTPMHNRAHQSKGEMAMDRYFRLLGKLDYPKELISLAILEGDSVDDTYAAAKAAMERLRGQGYRRLMLLKKDFGYKVPGGKEERHKHAHQLGRRGHLARLRNYLAVTALRDEEWVLWLDADLWSYPPDILQQLMASGKDFVVPHCVVDKGGQTFDLNTWQETEASLQLQDGMSGEEVLFEGYAGRPTHRKHMEALRKEGKAVVPVDGVGGALILLRSSLHREGVLFPPFPFQHAVETEGLAKVALAMGYQAYAMPNVEIEHK